MEIKLTANQVAHRDEIASGTVNPPSPILGSLDQAVEAFEDTVVDLGLKPTKYPVQCLLMV